MRQLRLFTWQNFMYTNYGDTLLSQSVRYLFDSFGSRRYFRVFDGADSRYRIGPAIAERANSFDAAVLAGGGQIIPRNLESSGWAFNSSLEMAGQLRRTIVFGIGFNLYGQHKTVPARFKPHFEALVEDSPFIGLRNHGSIERLKEVIDPRYHGRIRFQPCPTTMIRHLVEGFAPHDVPARERRVAVQITLSNHNLDDDVFSGKVLSALRTLRERGYRIEVVSFFDRFDAPFADYLRAHDFTDFDFLSLNTRGEDVLNGPRYYSTVPVTIASRGHGAMVPFGAGSIVIPVNVAPKIEFFAQSAGLADLLVDPRAADLADALVRNVEDAYARYDELQKQQQAQREWFYEVTLENLSVIYHSLTGEMPRERDCLPLNEFEVFLAGRLHDKTGRLDSKNRRPKPAPAALPDPSAVARVTRAAARRLPEWTRRKQARQ